MPKEGKTGLTIHNSTYQYAKDRKESFNEEQRIRKNHITWDEVVDAGIRDIEDKGVVSNPVTTHDNKTRHPSIGSDVHQDVNKRKKAFPLEITWDDIIIHGVDRSIDERMSDAGDENGQSEQEQSGNTDRLSEDDIREIVEEIVDERIREIEDKLERVIDEIEEDDANRERGLTESEVQDIVAEVIQGSKNEEILEVIHELTDPEKNPIVTTQEILNEVPLETRSLYNRLTVLHEDGEIHKKKVGDEGAVWWLADK